MVCLEKNHRVNPASIIIHENAVKVKNQKFDVVVDPTCFTFSPVTRILYNDLESTIKENPEINPWNTHFISPFREEANNIGYLAKQFMTGKIHAPGTFHKGDKILCTKNYSTLGVINGDFFKLCDILIIEEETGKDSNGAIITTYKVKSSTETTNCPLARNEYLRFMVVPASFTTEDVEEMETTQPFAVDIGRGRDKVPLTAFRLGYCTTNHQFQGCEADYVVFDLRKVSFFVNWKQVYTAITRAKKKVIILGNIDNFSNAVTTKVIPRRSRLFENLQQENEFLKTVPVLWDETSEDRIDRMLAEINFAEEEENNGDGNSNKRPATTAGLSNDNNNKRAHY
jgi:hypothetical protein